MSKARRAEIAQIGGQTAHKLGKAHQYTREEAFNVGRKVEKNKSKGGTHTGK